MARSDDSNLEGTSPPSTPSMAVAQIPAVIQTETEVEHHAENVVEAGPLTVLDHYLGTGPQASMMLLHRDAARAMEDFVRASEAGFLQVWPIDDEKSLVVYSRLLDQWNSIAAVSKIEVLRKPRRFPLIVASNFWQRWRARHRAT